MKTIEIDPPFIKLDSFLKFAGLSPDGGEAKRLVTGGGVLVNGQVCTMRGKKLYENDTVTVGGETYAVALKK